MTAEQLKKEIRKYADMTKQGIISRQKTPGQPFMVVYSKGKSEKFPFPYHTDIERTAARRAIQMMIRDTRPDAVLILSDIWFAERRTELPKGKSVSELPDRREAMMVLGGSVTGTYSILMPYKRGKRIVFEEDIEYGELFDTSFFGTVWDELSGKSTKH